jgi:hypothetical protein
LRSSADAKNPSLDSGHSAFGVAEIGFEVPAEVSTAIRTSHPFGDGIGIVLIRASIFPRER